MGKTKFLHAIRGTTGGLGYSDLGIKQNWLQVQTRLSERITRLLGLTSGGVVFSIMCFCIVQNVQKSTGDGVNTNVNQRDDES
jgi:hypothetical protein